VTGWTACARRIRLGGGLGQAEVLDFALGYQLPDRLSHILDRHVRVDAVLIEDIDTIGSRAPQGSFSDRLDVLRLAVQTGASGASLHVDVEAELCRNDNLVPDRAEHLADQFLVGEGTIGLGRIEQRHTALDRRVDQADHLLSVGRLSVDARHAHAAQPDCRNLRSAVSEFALLQLSLLRRTTSSQSALVLLVGNLLHPVHRPTVERLSDRDM